MPESVGVRELRQNLSKYLRQVERGERLVVTDRNRPVATLAPLPEHEDGVARLIAQGRLHAPADPTGSLSDIEPVKLDGDMTLSEALAYVRGHGD